MRRILLALTGTIAGLAALLGFKSISTSAGTAMAAGTTSGSSASASASTGTAGTAGTDGTGKAASSSGKSSASSRSSSASTGATTTARTVTGAVAQTEYGPMQIQLNVVGKKIVAVHILQKTDSGAESQQIDANAIPQLTKETLAAQSARINAVSGASYTSQGYIKSLQSAIDQANL